MTPVELSALFLAAAGTAWLTAVAGLGGGLVLLAILLRFMDPAEAIPVHGAIQLVSNGTRAWTLREHVRWGLVGRHGVLLVPGGLLGLELIERIPRALGRGLIGALALVATWRPAWITPRWITARWGGRFPAAGFYGLGAAHGLLNMPLGATGPLIAPFFRAALPERRAMVGSFAAAQVLGHLVKIALFGLLAGFSFAEHGAALTLGAVGVTLGTLVGTRQLEKVSEEAFGWVFRAVVTLVSIPLIYGAF